jgi:hypothetical protein
LGRLRHTRLRSPRSASIATLQPPVVPKLRVDRAHSGVALVVKAGQKGSESGEDRGI